MDQKILDKIYKIRAELYMLIQDLENDEQRNIISAYIPELILVTAQNNWSAVMSTCGNIENEAANKIYERELGG